MTFAYFTVLITGFLPLMWAAYAKFTSGFKGRDNNEPRNFLNTLTGKAQRANWAQQNGWEAFPGFAAAVIIANLCQANPERVDLYAGTFLVARLLHGVFYIADLASLRSLVWFLGLAANLGLYYLAYKGAN